MRIELDRSSFSQYSTFMGCPKKYYWNYVRNLVPIATPSYFDTGKSFHEGAAGLDGETVWHKVGRMAAEYYGVIPNEDHEVRTEFDMGDGITLVAIADILIPDAIGEWKLTSRANSDNVNAHSMSLQLRLNAIAFNKERAFLRMVKKTQIRQRKDENEEMFEQRIISEYRDKPEEHFLHIDVAIEKKGAVSEFLMTVANINNCMKRDVWPKAAPYACCGMTTCPYLQLCQDEATNLPLYKEKQRV